MCVFVQVFKDLFGDMLYNEGFSLRPVLLHPQTRGVVRLKSRDPTDHPYIEPNYLAHPDDIKILLEGTRCNILSLPVDSCYCFLCQNPWP